MRTVVDLFGRPTGPEWLDLGAPEAFAASAAQRFDQPDDGGQDVRWRTSVDVNRIAIDTHLLGRGRSTRPLSTRPFLRLIDNVLAAHVLVALELRKREPSTTIAIGLLHRPEYEFGGLLVDLLVAAGDGVPLGQLRDHLVARRARWLLSSAAEPSLADRARRRLAASVVLLEQSFPRTVTAGLAARGSRLLDEVHLTVGRGSTGAPPPEQAYGGGMGHDPLVIVESAGTTQ